MLYIRRHVTKLLRGMTEIYVLHTMYSVHVNVVLLRFRFKSLNYVIHKLYFAFT